MKQKFFALAKKLANKSNHTSHQLGCVIVKKNRIISVGWNQLKTHPKSTHPFRSIHAEFSAVTGVEASELKGATLYVYRERHDGTLGMARPCNSCLEMLRNLELDFCCYSTYNSYKKEKL